MAFPDRIERTVTLTRGPREVWQALTTAEGLSAWFGERASIDLRPGGAAALTFYEPGRRGYELVYFGGRLSRRVGEA